MVRFEKNCQEVLPYDRDNYTEFLFGEAGIKPEWFGVSFQLKDDRNTGSFEIFLNSYRGWLKELLQGFGSKVSWIVNHDKADQDWFPNNEPNLHQLRGLFKENKIKRSFRGALIFDRDTILGIAEDLLAYPVKLFGEEGLYYTNLDISNKEFPFVIKISDHLNLDLLSTDPVFLANIARKSLNENFIIKQYRGTSIL